MPRLTGRDQPVEVQIILASGKVINFKVPLGDTIGMQVINTVIGKGSEATPHKYYTLTLVPGEQLTKEEGA